MKDDFDSIIERANALTSPRFSRTGVFATEEEAKEIVELGREAATAPVILLGGSDLSASTSSPLLTDSRPWTTSTTASTRRRTSSWRYAVADLYPMKLHLDRALQRLEAAFVDGSIFVEDSQRVRDAMDELIAAKRELEEYEIALELEGRRL